MELDSTLRVCWITLLHTIEHCLALFKQTSDTRERLIVRVLKFYHAERQVNPRAHDSHPCRPHWWTTNWLRILTTYSEDQRENAALLGYGVCLVRNEETGHFMAHSQTNTYATETKVFASVSNTFLIGYEVVRTREGKVDTPRTHGDRHWAKAAKCYAYTCECLLQVTTKIFYWYCL